MLVQQSQSELRSPHALEQEALNLVVGQHPVESMNSLKDFAIAFRQAKSRRVFHSPIGRKPSTRLLHKSVYTIDYGVGYPAITSGDNPK